MTTRSAKSSSQSITQPATRKLWLAAAKPPMYSVAIMPILVGSLMAYAETGQFMASIFGLFFLSAIFILAWENLSNDVFDSETGIDVNKAHSVVNLTRNKGLVFALANGYQGLGEILCFLSFGPLGVGAAYYSQTQSWSWGSQMAGIFVGLTTSLVLFCSHFHQVEDDIAAGKRSPIVRMGTHRGAQGVPLLAGAALATVALSILMGWFPAWTALAFASALSAWKLSHHVQRHHHQPQKVSHAKFYAVGFHFWSGVLLSLGFLLSNRFIA
jgi:1,4-dihydroxy-2-naphthoate octaprenyltransferase